MCNLFGGGDDGAAEAELQAARDASNKALLAQKQAKDQAVAASDSDSETSRLAKEAQLRKLASAGAFGASFAGADASAPSVAVRQLFGAAA